MLSWLQSELKAAFTPDVSARFALDFTGRRVTLLERVSGGFVKRREVRYGAADFETAMDHIRALVARRTGRAVVDVMIPEDMTLFRVETFPAEAREHLREEAWWRLDAMTPFNPEDVFYDVALLEIEPKTGFTQVHVAVAPRDVVDELVRYARRWGFDPQRVTSSVEADGFPYGPLFHLASDAPKQARRLKRGAAALAIMALLLTALGAWRGVSEREALAEAAEARQREAEAGLGAALALREDTLSLAELAMRPAERRLSSRMAVDWLDALAETLPADVETSRVVLEGRGLRIEGVGSSAAAARGALEEAEEFGAVVYASPVARPKDAPRLQSFALEALLRPGEEGAAAQPSRTLGGLEGAVETMRELGADGESAQ